MLINLNLSTVPEGVKQELNHASFTWKIPNFMDRQWRRDDFIKSERFRCADVPWVLYVYPNGTNKYPGGYVRLNLHKGTTKNYTVSAKFTIPRSGGQETVYEVDKYSFKDDFEIMHREEVRRSYLKDGTFTIKCDMTVFEANVSEAELCKGEESPEKKEANTNTSSKDFDTLYSSDGPKTDKDDIATLLSDFEALHKTPRFADVILKVGEREFPAHKVVLRSRSKVFDAMFDHDMQENRRDIVDLVDMEVDTVKDMLRYIYCGKVRQLSPEAALNLYVTADRYDLQGLLLNCRKIMLNELSIDNICEIASLADLHNDRLLTDAVKPFLYKNMKEIFKTDKWMMFAKENPILSLNLIQSAAINN